MDSLVNGGVSTAVTATPGLLAIKWWHLIIEVVLAHGSAAARRESAISLHRPRAPDGETFRNKD
jgi:hypothetical protein